jgi:uncharacterized protein (TIGR02271 family)
MEQIGLATHSSDHKGDSVWDRIVKFFEGNENPGTASGTTTSGNPSNYECDYDPESFRGSLGSLGVSGERARYFESRLNNEKESALVTVNATPARVREAETILERDGADLGAKADKFEYPQAQATELQRPQTRKIQLLGEVLRVHKQQIPRGEVRIRKEVVSENQTIEVPVSREELVIDRHAGTKETPAGKIGADSEIRIPLTEERVTVEKRPTVREEVAVGKRRVEQTQRVSDQVRHEELRVEKDGKEGTKGTSSEKTPDRKTA